MKCRAFAVWLLMMLVESIHGTARALFLVDVVGQKRSNQIGVFVGALLILGVALLTIRWIGPKGKRDLFIVGLLWFVFTLVFEIGLGGLSGGRTRVWADYDVKNGGLMPFGLIFLAFSPLLAAKIRSTQ